MVRTGDHKQLEVLELKVVNCSSSEAGDAAGSHILMDPLITADTRGCLSEMHGPEQNRDCACCPWA